MARFRATVKGDKSNSSEASRLGHRHITTKTASWAGAVEVYFYKEEDGKDYCEVKMVPHMEVGETRLLYRGLVGTYAPQLGA